MDAVSQILEDVAIAIQEEYASINGARLSSEHARRYAHRVVEALRVPTAAMCKSQTAVTSGMADLIWCRMMDAVLK